MTSAALLSKRGVLHAEAANSGSFSQMVSAAGITTARSGSGTHTFERPIFWTVDGSQLTGLFTCTSKSVSYAPNSSYPALLESIEVPGAAKISNVLAADDDYGRAAGTIVIGASKAISTP